MELGTLLPLGDIGGDPATVREYAQAAEAIGLDFVEAPDHVLGVNAASRPGWDRNNSEDLFHDPFVLFGYLAGCTGKLGFSTGVLILPQRQTVLVAKQAASLDVLSGGRFRLGIGVGWNEVEFTGLNENFHNRGRRSEEQVQVMQKLWAEPHVELQGPLAHDRGCRHQPAPGFGPGAGMVRRPSRPHPRAHRQMGRWLDAERLSARPYRDGNLRPAAPSDRRRPAATRPRSGSRSGCRWAPAAKPIGRRETRFWKAAGASHICLTTTFNRRHHQRIPGNTLADHLGALRRYHSAVAAEL